MRITLALIAVAVVAGCGSGPSYDQVAPESSRPAPLDRVSNRGTPFSELRPRDEQALSRFQYGPSRRRISVEDISILGTRGDRSFYRLGDHCYGAGPASPTNHAFGHISCVPDFPSPDVPVLDATVFGSSAGPGERPPPETLTVHASEGIAADGVATVALVDTDGQVVAETPVLDNIYRFERVPTGTALRVVAYSTTGEVVFSQPKHRS